MSDISGQPRDGRRMASSAAPAAAANPEDTPLVVDLDGTLVAIDTTLACILALCRRPHPRRLLSAAWGTWRSRAALKRRLAAAAGLDPALLPYNAEMLAYLREQRAAGRLLVLATGADRSIAEAVARHLGLFDIVLASDGRTNLTGPRKLAAIADRLGARAFTYAGNSKTDLAIWRAAASGICVNARKPVAAAAARATRIERVFPPVPLPLRLLFAATGRKR